MNAVPVNLPPRTDRRSEVLLWCGLILTLVPQLVRATSNSTTFPHWDQDPLTYALSAPALTPADSLLIDASTLLGAAMLLLRATRSRVRLNTSLILLAAIGAVAVVLHGWILASDGEGFRGSLANQRIGASWLAAIVAAVAIYHAAQDPRVRRLLAGTLIGLVALLALAGIVQVYYVHPESLANFNANPGRFLAAHGWAPESAMAKSFIRRLSQPEASAWFGLANVFTTFAAASLVGTLCLLVRCAKFKRSFWCPWLLLLPAAFAATGLILSHAKGGYLAVAGGLVAAAIFFLLTRTANPRARRLAGALGAAAIIGPIALIIIRGQLGEDALHGERSLLFRWYYLDAATRIFAEHPLLGVGPASFQPAFTLHKNPLCPEEVQSPHCIPLDYLADLGVLGLSWIILLARLGMAAATRAVALPAPAPAVSRSLSRNDTRLLLIIPAIATLLAAFIESPYITPDSALVRVGGLLLWCASAWAIARAVASGPLSAIALAAASLAALAHAQIDVTASLPASAPLWAMLIAVAAAPDVPATPNDPPHRLVARVAPPIAIAALTVLLAISSITRARPWQQHLEAAAAVVRPIADISDRLEALTVRPAPGERSADSLDAIVRDLRTLTGDATILPSAASVNAARLTLLQRRLPAAALELEQAYLASPDDHLPLREASRLHLQLAALTADAGLAEDAAAHFREAIRVLRLVPTATDIYPFVHHPGASELAWLASIYERRAQMLRTPDDLHAAVQHRLRLTTLDPSNLDNALKLCRDYQTLGDAPNASLWAANALRFHEYTRLDRETRGLSPTDLAELQAAAGASDNGNGSGR